MGCRKVAVINLDPANDALPYPNIYFVFSIRASLFFHAIGSYGFFLCLVHIGRVISLHDNRYECAINIEDLIKLSDVMAEHSLGPNGGMTIILSMFHLCLNVLGFRHFRHPVVWSLFMKVHLLVQVTLLKRLNPFSMYMLDGWAQLVLIFPLC